MSDRITAKLFAYGGGQAVRVEGKEEIVEPALRDAKALFALIDSFGDVPFMDDEADQPSKTV